MSSLNRRAEVQAVAAPLTQKEIHRVFYGLMLGGFLSAVNQTIVATALPTIGRDLGDFENLSWVIIAYLLSSTVVAPLYGKLSDIHGRRAMMLVALGLFVAGSAAAAAAPNMAVLIAARTLQGIGGGGIVPMVQTTVADMITPRERGHYQAYMGTAWVAAGVVGPALGGIIADQLHWAAIFWLNVPLGLVAAGLTWHAMRRLPRQQRAHQLDLLGAALVMAAATLLLLALTCGGTRFAWLSPAELALVGGSIALTLAFAWWLKRAPEPFLPLDVLANPVMRVGTAATSCALGVMTGFMIYMPLYFQVVHKLTATQAGLALIPVIVMTTPGSMLAGRAMMHLQHYKIAAYIGASITLLAVAALVWWPAMPLSAAVIATGVVGFGVGTVFPTSTVSIQNAVARTEVGVATGAMNFFRALVSALVVAIMGAILLAGIGVTPERGGVAVELTVAHAGAAESAVAEVFRRVFVAALVFSALSLAAVILLEERPLHGPGREAPSPVPKAPPAPADRPSSQPAGRPAYMPSRSETVLREGSSMAVIWEPDLAADAAHWRTLAARLTAEHFAPAAQSIDHEQRYPADNVRLLIDRGLTGLFIPRPYGGQGASLTATVAVVESIGSGCASTAAILCVCQLGAFPVLLAGREEQKKFYLGEMVKGVVTSFALSERSTGSDAAAIETTAVRQGDGWRLHGEKYWIGNGGESRYYVVFAKTDPVAGARGISAFMVDKEAPGIVIDDYADKMGIRGTKTSNLKLDTHVPDSARVGEVNRGLRLALATLEVGRVMVAAQSLGLALAAYREASRYAVARRTFGRPIIENQGIAFKLADMAAEISAARMMLYEAAKAYDAGRSVANLAAMAKLFGSEVAHRVADSAVQIFGGLGYCKPSVVERLYRDQRILEIYEGTSEIQRLVIARAVRKEAEES